MNTWYNRSWIVIVAACNFYSCTAKSSDLPKIQPNVLMITVDDMRDWVGYLGGYKGKVYTPNIDRLASEGVAFMNAQTSATVCCPSRNSMMLGKRPSTTGLYDNDQWWKADCPDEIPMPEYFKNHGYYTVCAGKVFHHTPGNNPPCSWNECKDQVFDDPWNFAEWSPERYFLKYGYRGPIVPYPKWKPLNGIYPIKSALDWGAIPGKKEQDYGDVQAVNFATSFLKRAHDQPFFLCVGTYRPHLPWHVPQKYFDMYPLDKIVLPEVKDDDLDDVPAEGQKLAHATTADFKRIVAAGKWKEAVQAYLACITFADAQVGNILKALKESKFQKNTIVILWSDHGWQLGTKQHWYKTTLWEECTRIPFTIKAPGITHQNSVCNQPIDMVNVFPTLISLCGLPAKNDLDGHDLTPLLLNPDASWDYPAISEIKVGDAAVRSLHWRYIRYKDGMEELYDRDKDPNEWTNLAGDKAYSEVIAKNLKLIPSTFHKELPGKDSFYFDPYAYTFLNRQTKEFIDGGK